ncbi:tumor protein p53-inducible nuclear protein 1 isoform X2 [Denticeps clupeoides]|uniref:tumor protein p53-inducible nuclear protein 1 isoform X2 n=1 Tax=Denticeps clupeoides TaxID=299321 RepID=UPI0010A541DB|nr:tumor protein p53-inducible nuclear protein 1 isoform X2 [Denticeps clupeoides]
MFQRFTNILFGDVAEDVHRCPPDPVFDEKEGNDEWILVDYLEACGGSCVDGLVEVCSEDITGPDCPVRYSSCSSLDSDPEDGGFLRLDADCSLEESWFITPPPCFTAGGKGPILLETSPLENLLIEHPSMSVYAVHTPRHHSAKKERSHDPSLFRTEPHRQSHPTGCYAATYGALGGFLEQTKPGRLTQRLRDNVDRQQLSRKALRRLNQHRDGGARQAKATGGVVHQPGQRHFNY